MIGPFPIGWDTIAFYVPVTMDWATGNVSWPAMFGTAPLMYMISVPVYLLLHVNPIWIFKVMGPVLYGSMIAALYRFLRLGLHWTQNSALKVTLFTMLYFVTLRTSWDLYRNMLGLTFIFLALAVMEESNRTSKLKRLSGLVVLAILSDQLTGVIVLVIISVRAISALTNRRVLEFRQMAMVATPGAAIFLFMVYTGLVLPGIGLVMRQSPAPTLTSVWSSLGFLTYAYLAPAWQS